MPYLPETLLDQLDSMLQPELPQLPQLPTWPQTGPAPVPPAPTMRSIPPVSPLAQAPTPERGPVENALSWLGRPLQATTSAVAAGLRGEDVGQAAWQGLQGLTPTRGWGDVMAQQGVPEMGNLQLGPLNITGRGALGFAADVALDPLNLLFPLTAARKGLKGAELAAKAAEAFVPKGIRLADAVTQLTTPTAARELAGKVGEIPVVGRVLRGINPNAILPENQPLLQALRGYDNVAASISNGQAAVTAPFRRPPYQMLANNRVLLTNGDRVPIMDVLRYPGRYDDLVTAEQRTWNEAYRQASEAITQTGRDLGVAVKGRKLAEDETYVHWEVTGGPPAALERPSAGQALVGGVKAYMKPSKYRTIAEGEAAGWNYAGPVEALGEHYRQMRQAVVEKELADELKPYAAQLVVKGRELGEKGALARRTFAGTLGAEVTQVKHPALRGLWFSPEDANLIQKSLGQQAPEWIGKLSGISNVARTMQAGLDLSAGMIQGLPLLVRDPVAWGKAWLQGIRSAIDPSNLARYMALPDSQRVMEVLPGLQVAAGEFTQALPGISGMLGKVPGAGQPAARALSAGYQRGAAAFETFGIVARLESAKGFLPMVERNPGLAGEIADYINKMTGTLTAGSLGLTRTEQAVENALLFAPKYTRAALGLMVDALQGGLRGDEARKALGAMLVGGIATYIKMAHELGQEPNLDPSTGRFLTIKLGTDNVGPGSAWVAMARLLGSAISDPGDLLNTSFGGKEPGQEIRNPVIRFLRSRLAPLPSTGWDVVTQQTYVGDPIESRIDLAKYAGSRFLPFALEAYVTQNPRASLESLPAQVGGMRVFPQSYAERRQALTEEQFPGRKYEELPPSEAQRINAAAKALGLPVRGEANIQRQQVFERYDERMVELANFLSEGTIDRNQYRGARQEALAQLSYRLNDVEAQEAKGKSPEEAQKWKDERLAKMTPRERARQQYLDILGRRDELGKPDFDAAETFLASQPAEVRKYVEEMATERIKNLPPVAAKVELDLRQARLKLRPYWELANDVLRERGILKRYQDATPAQRTAIERTPAYREAEREWRRRRELMRQANPEVDRLLVEWYGRVPMEQQATGLPGLPAAPRLPTAMMR